jgi:hypothetical protein
MHLTHPSHPIWAIIKIGVICFFCAVAMYIYATEYDETEMKSLGTFALMLGGAEGIKRGVCHFLSKDEQEKSQ